MPVYTIQRIKALEMAGLMLVVDEGKATQKHYDRMLVLMAEGVELQPDTMKMKAKMLREMIENMNKMSRAAVPYKQDMPYITFSTAKYVN